MRRLSWLAGVLAVSLAGTATPELKTFKERLPGTTVEFEMVYIPPGKIELPDPENPAQTRVYEVGGFWIGKTEVTWDEYGTYAFNTEIAEIEKQRGADAIAKPSKPYGAIDRGYGYEGNPAIGMTFQAAQRYCEWLSRITGKKYRLPTEAEWEYAARAGVLKREPLPRPQIDKMAWHAENSDLKPHKVAQKQPNAWGLHDMLGNVMEWCVGLGGKAVACGGSFMDPPDQVHPGARARQTPDWNMTDPQYPKSRWWLSDAPFVGLRVVCEAPANP
ncbi:MAG: formylglycine-generating enzyme family protein [Armatimonadota bacterium]|nr:formylglycine-generating enzyme family protein [Armatimonadota bacterium]